MKKQAFNPFLPLDICIPDGEPHVFGDRIYLFGSHDREGGNTFCMEDYTFWSAPVDDLSNWSSRGVNYRAKQDPLYSERLPYMFAPDVVRGNDGRYYLYYCMAGRRGEGGYSNPISVAVCDTPDGQYEYLGVVQDRAGRPLMRYVCFDPAVINDDGVIRLYYGTCYPFENFKNPLTKGILAKVQARIFGRTPEEILRHQDGVMGAITVVLENDMLTAAEEPKRILPTRTKGTEFAQNAFFEGSSIRKIGDAYYFIYSSTNNHELCYAVSKYPDRDFHFGGTLISNGDIGIHGRKPKDRLNTTGTNHGSIECVNGQWYVFYHRLSHATDYSRQACAEPIAIAADGSIRQQEVTSCGLNGGPLAGKGVYPAVIACVLTNGKMPHISNQIYKKPLPCVSSGNGEQFIRNLTNGTQIGYRYFDLSETTYVSVTMRGGQGTLEVLDGLDGRALGSMDIPAVREWSSFGLRIAPTKGKSSLFFRWNSQNSADFLRFALK